MQIVSEYNTKFTKVLDKLEESFYRISLKFL